MADVVVNGGTGYLGQRLVRALIARGHQVRVLARPQSLAYIDARVAGEATIREAGLTATVLRPWYVLGPGTGGPPDCSRCTGSSS